MNAPTETTLKKGYVLVPRSMIGDFLRTGSQTEGCLEIWIQASMRVNYSDTEVCVQGDRIVCRRGETVYTYRQWGKTLGWSRYRTRRFFGTLFKSRIMEMVENPAGITLLRVTDYDLWTGHKEATTTRDSHATEGFTDSWDLYRRVTQKDKINIACTRKEWKKLTVTGKKLALESIKEYYTHQKDIRFYKRATTCLEGEAFLNECEF